MFLRFHSEISLLILVVRFKKLWCTIIARTCAAGRALVRNHGRAIVRARCRRCCRDWLRTSIFHGTIFKVVLVRSWCLPKKTLTWFLSCWTTQKFSSRLTVEKNRRFFKWRFEKWKICCNFNQRLTWKLTANVWYFNEKWLWWVVQA